MRLMLVVPLIGAWTTVALFAPCSKCSGRDNSDARLSSSLQPAFQRWLNEKSVGQLLSASIGNDPRLRDVLGAFFVSAVSNTHVTASSPAEFEFP